MTARSPFTPHLALRRKWLATCIAVAVAAIAAIALGLFSQQPQTANAAATVAQCNGEQNAGGAGIRCTVTVVNYVTAGGALSATPASTVTMERCVGAAGPIGAGAGTCATTTTTSVQPVATVQQCNGSGSGGGGVVICTATITNHFTGSPAAITAATVYQCIGSVITGTGAPGTCTPVNTPGVTSVAAATVGQCTGSGNGGTSVGFICSVTGGSTMTVTLPVNIDQCNGSANGGGALTNCTATVTNDVIAAPTAVPTAVPSVVVPTAAPSVVVPTAAPSVVVPPGPPATGNAGLAEGSGPSHSVRWSLGIATVLGSAAAGVVLARRRLASRRPT